MSVRRRSRGTRKLNALPAAVEGSVPDRRTTRSRRRGAERGQILVEFALAAPVLMLLGFGIVQFGLAINYWLDLHKVVDQGARWAAVNEYPGCPQTGPEAPCDPTLQTYLGSQSVASSSVAICFEQQSGSPSGAVRGDPVTVRLTSPFSLIPLLGAGTINLTASATMRVEEAPTRYSAGAC